MTHYKVIGTWMLPVLWIVTIVGCGRPAMPSVPVNDPWVGVAGFAWDQHHEEQELTGLLRTNGIKSVAHGSIHVGIGVHQSQFGLAMALLKTNHLVTSGKVVLLEGK